MTDALLAGESWQTIATHTKSRELTATSSYTGAADHLVDALEPAGADVTYQPCHVAHREFPRTVEDLREYGLVRLNDVGSQTIQITPRVAAGETDADVLATLNGDPLFGVGDHGEWRAFVHATDCAPHWAPSGFLEWDDFPTLRNRIIERVTGAVP